MQKNTMSFFETTLDGAISIYIRAIPNSSKSAIGGIHNKMLKVYLTSPPQDGKANKELIALLSKALDISRSKVVIEKGETDKNKIILIENPPDHLIATVKSLPV